MKTRLFALGFAGIAALLVACGGGGGSSGGGVVPHASPSSGPTSPPIPQSSPYSISATINVPQPTPAPQGKVAGPFSIKLPQVYNPDGSSPLSGSVIMSGQYATVGTGETTFVTVTNEQPSGIALPSSIFRSPHGRHAMYASGQITIVAYIEMQFRPNVVGLEEPPSFSIKLPSADLLPQTNYWLALYDPTQANVGWQMAFEGPEKAPASGNTLTFSGSGPFDFANLGSTYVFALYAANSTLPQPTPAPTTPPASFGCNNQPFSHTRRAESSGPRPLANGDSWTYGGLNSTLTQTMSRVAPCPMPTSTAVAAVTDSVNVSATTAPDGSSAFDVNSVESDAFPTNTSTTTIDAIDGESSSSEYTYGSTVTDENGDTIKTSYATPQTLDKLPESFNNVWTLNPKGSVTESLVDGTSIIRTYASDGSYNESDNTRTGSAAITVTPSGSGGYALNGLATLSYGAPQNGSITLTLSASKTSQSLAIPAWFTTPVVLYQDTFRDVGSGTPNWCNPPGTPGQTEEIDETLNVTDPVLGYTESRTVWYYDSQSYGTVCMQIDDTMNQYYDYMLDTPFLVFLSGNGQPNQTNTISEYYVMNAVPTLFSQHRRTGMSRSFIHARLARIEALRSEQRAQMRSALHNYLMRYARGGQI